MKKIFLIAVTAFWIILVGSPHVKANTAQSEATIILVGENERDPDERDPDERDPDGRDPDEEEESSSDHPSQDNLPDTGQNVMFSLLLLGFVLMTVAGFMVRLKYSINKKITFKK